MDQKNQDEVDLYLEKMKAVEVFALRETERLAFINSSGLDFMSYLIGLFGEERIEKFKTEALEKSNYVQSMNKIYFILESGEIINSKWGTGAMRNCPSYGSDFCVERRESKWDQSSSPTISERRLIHF